jgi:hypothetical protein
MRKMKLTLFFFMVVSLFILGCDNNSVDYTSNIKSTKNCIFPQNPYNDGGGHDAGFNWAAENGGNCDGKSDSFNEGCTEYFIQLIRYNECVANIRNK